MWNYGFSYIEGENLFLDSGGHMDEYYDIVYSIEDGTFVVQAKGECGAEDNANIQFDAEGFPIYNYYWNGNQVSGEAEYEELLNKAFDKGRAKQNRHSVKRDFAFAPFTGKIPLRQYSRQISRSQKGHKNALQRSGEGNTQIFTC